MAIREVTRSSRPADRPDGLHLLRPPMRKRGWHWRLLVAGPIREIGLSKSIRGWEHMREMVGKPRNMCAVGARYGCERLSRGSEIEGLADDRVDARLERTPGAWDAQARMSLDDRAHHGVCGEMSFCRDDIGIDADHACGPFDDVDQALPIREVSTQQQVIATTGTELEHAGIAVKHDCSPIHAILHGLDSGNRTPRQIAQRCVPVERRVERQPKRQATIGDQSIVPSAALAQITGCRTEDVSHRSVEVPHTAEARRERDLCDGEIGVVQEASREMGAARIRQLRRGDTDVVAEQPAEVTCRYRPIVARGLLHRRRRARRR